MSGKDPDREGFDELESRVRGGVSRLRGLGAGDQIEIEVLSSLVESKMTIAELVERIYGLGRQDEGFASSYTKVRRATRRLESKGLVSTRLLGKEKPYRLTEHAVANLARIGGGQAQRPLFPRQDLVIHLATLALSVPILLIAREWLSLSDPVMVVVFACFFYLLGASSTRLVQTLRRVT